MLRRTLLAIFLLILFAFTNPLFAQKEIVLLGVITSPNKAPLESANILLNYADSTTILRFTSSNENGSFQINLSENELVQNGLLLKVQLLGYETQIKPLQKGQTVYNFTLKEVPILLKDIVVKGGKPQLRFNGDTTSYLVKDFASVQDRSIGDVLKRLPGISVEDNGLIKFNGISVKKLYLYEDLPQPENQYYGEIKYQYEYKNQQGDWFNWLYIDQKTLLKTASKNGWKAGVLYEDEMDLYLARLTL